MTAIVGNDLVMMTLKTKKKKKIANSSRGMPLLFTIQFYHDIMQRYQKDIGNV